MMRQGIRAAVNQQADMMVCGEAETVQEALRGIEQARPDVIVVDLSLKESNGLDLLKDLRIRCPHSRSLVLSMHDESFYAERVLHAGAQGFVSKQEGPQRVLEGIRQVAKGGLCFSERAKAKLITKSLGGCTARAEPSVESLTDRELEVLEHLGRGFASGEIAAKLNLSIKTIETHRAHIKEKLGLRDAGQLVKYACHWVRSRP